MWFLIQPKLIKDKLRDFNLDWICIAHPDIRLGAQVHIGHNTDL